jgi:glutathione transport system permease protein
MSISATEANAAKAALVESAIRTPWSEFWRKFRKQHVALGAGIFVLLLVVIAILAPHIVPYDPEISSTTTR